VAVCLAVALCSSEAYRLPGLSGLPGLPILKPPPILTNQVEEWKEDAQEVKDHIEEELQNIKDKWEDFLNGIGGGKEEVTTEPPQEETTAAPEEATTTTQVPTTAAAKTTTPVICFHNIAHRKFGQFLNCCNLEKNRFLLREFVKITIFSQ
jgi:hypothetical protein